MPTEFYLATTAQDFRACHEILDKLGRKAALPLSFPTIVGKRNGRIVAFLATRPIKKEKAIVVNELGVDPNIGQPQFLLLKLLDTYEAYLRHIGIVSFLFCVPLVFPEYIDIIGRVSGLKPYTQDSQVAWFNRRLD